MIRRATEPASPARNHGSCTTAPTIRTALLDDPAFFAPFAPHFHPVLGRPSTPVECYLRLMFLKFRHRLGYESLCAEVADSISWRRFCRIPLDGKVPHPTTLMKLTTRCGQDAVAGLNEALWAKAAGQKLLRTTRVRADTTVICANVAYPTDSGLLAKAVGKLVRAARRVQACGGATGTGMTDRRRAAARRVRGIAPRQGTTTATRKTIEHSRSFHRLVKWRTGCEGRISYLKHAYGWNRTHLDDRKGAAIRCGHGVFAHNLIKIGALAS
jgi:IS5 family transposase